MKEVILIGYSGHAYIVADVLESIGFKIFGYLDKIPNTDNPLKLNYLGFEQDKGVLENLNGFTFFPAIGDNEIRKKVIQLASEKKASFITAVSPRAYISPRAVIRSATLVCQGACINAFAQIGTGVIINTSSVVEHECIISDFVHIAPGAVLAGNVSVGENSFIGANSVIKQGVKIGRNATIGAGTVVLHDIPDGEIWVGNPAKRKTI